MSERRIKLEIDPRSGRLVRKLSSSDNVDRVLESGNRVITIPESLFFPGGQRNRSGSEDPRIEMRLQMQRENLGTGCTSGNTAGITGCGKYNWNERIYQNLTTVENKTATSSTVHYSTTVHKFGRSSAKFPGRGIGVTGAVLIFPNDAPGLSLGGRGAHLGGPSGGSMATAVSAGFSGDVLMQTWFYRNTGVAADQVLFAQGASSGGGSGCSFKLYLQNSSGRLMFECSNNGDTPTDYGHSLIVSPSTGLTVGQWHHVAILYQSRWHSSNGSEVWGAFNGATTAANIQIGLQHDLLHSEEPISVGGLQDGALPFYGYLDDFHIQHGPSGGTVSRGITGPTYTLAATGATVDPDSTIALFSFNGPSGCDKFSVDNYERVEAIATSWSTSNKKLGVRDIVLRGHATGGFDIAYGAVEGDKSGSHYYLSCTGGTLMALATKRSLKQSQLEEAAKEYLNLVSMSGNSGSSQDFLNLYGNHSGSGHGSPRFHGNHADGFKFTPNDGDFQKIGDHLKFIQTQGGTPGVSQNRQLLDQNGNIIALSGGHIAALYADVYTFRNNLHEDLINRISDVASVSSNAGESYNEISKIQLTASSIKSKEENNELQGFGQQGSFALSIAGSSGNGGFGSGSAALVGNPKAN